ncbi:MAG: hypothetical protein ACRYG8_37075 [Janthinobacterium lividum]
MQVTTSGGHRLPGELVADMIDTVRAILPARLTRSAPTPFKPGEVMGMWN